MPESAGVALTHWTARLVVAAWALAVLLLVARRSSEREPPAARWFWTLAWLLLVAHTLCAFAFVHHWRYAAANEHTIRQTVDVTGFDFRYGLLVNFGFLAWWTLDVVAWWLPATRLWRQRRGYQVAMHATFALIILNATVVFGPPYWKAVGIVFALAIAACIWRARRSSANVTL